MKLDPDPNKREWVYCAEKRRWIPNPEIRKREWRKNMENRDLIHLLHRHIVEVTFTKVDGTERVMKCTLREDVIPAPENDGMQQSGFTPKRQANPNVAAVWDVEANGWRSFRFDSVKDIILDGEITS